MATTEILNETERTQAATAANTNGSNGLNGMLANPKVRRRLSFAAVFLAVLIVSLLAYYHNRVSTDDAQVDGHLAPVASKIAGNIAEVLVDDNQVVKRGQPLVKLDARDYEVKVAQARAALALAEAQARGASVGVPLAAVSTQSGVSSADAQVQAAQAEYDRLRVAYDQASTSELAYARANVAAAEAANDKAQSDLARMQPLLKKAEISKQSFDGYTAASRVAASQLAAARERALSADKQAEASRSAMLNAKAKLEQARAGLRQSQANTKQVDIQTASRDSASAAVEQARANLRAAELQLEYATIVAPVDGLVTRKSAEPGQIVQPGQNLLTIIPLHNTWVTANFKETQLAKVRPGQEAEIKVDMYGKTFKGKVDSIASATGARMSLLPPENATGNYVKVVQRIPVKILVERTAETDLALRPGMNVEATVITR